MVSPNPFEGTGVALVLLPFLGLFTPWNLAMTFPFDITPENLPPYYQQVYEELMEGIETNEITIMPCLNRKYGFIVWMIVRIKLQDEGLDEDGNSLSSMSVTPLSLISPPSITDEVEPILPKTSEVDFIREEDNDFEPLWEPPTQGTMKFPTKEED